MNDFAINVYRNGITSSTLKTIAALFMLLDHIGFVLLERMILVHSNGLSCTNSIITPMLQNHTLILQLYYVDLVLRYVGKVAFLIYAFLLVEGFLHTRNLKKYIGSLFLFSIISEIPFNLAGSGKLFNIGHQNVFFTLCIGLLVITCFHNIQQRELSPFPQLFAKVVILALGCLLSYGIQCDYHTIGIALIALLYEFRFYRDLGVFAGGILLTTFNSSEITSLFAIIPISLYNGKKGSSLKYSFYVFYPLHLFLLYLAAHWMGLSSVVVF